MHNFAPDCVPDQRAVQDRVRDHLRGQPGGFTHISSPIDGDPNKIRRVELIRKSDPSLVEKLPFPVWTVAAGEYLLYDLGAVGEHPAAAMVSMDVHGSFDAEHAAREAAKGVLDDKVQQSPGFVKHVRESPSRFVGLVARPGSVKWMVQVTYDNGAARDSEGYGT